jgi:hypothetical protein
LLAYVFSFLFSISTHNLPRYEEMVNTQVMAVNGSKVNNLAELVERVEGCEGRWLRFDLDYAQALVLDREKAMQATAEILEQHCIASDRSPDLVAAEGEDEKKRGKRKGGGPAAPKGGGARGKPGPTPVA